MIAEQSAWCLHVVPRVRVVGAMGAGGELSAADERKYHKLRETRQVHISQHVYRDYCRRVVDRLLDERSMGVAALVRGKYRLRDAVIRRVQQLRTREGSGRRGISMT